MAELSNKVINVGILGASGYAGGELVRLLVRHPNVDIRVLTAERRAGRTMAEVFPHLAGLELPRLVATDDADWSDVNVAFCALPHGTTQVVVAGLPGHLKVIDLSADFRFKDIETYAEWYGHPHRAPELQRDAVYGLTEIKRKDIAGARLVAVPGCYPTGAQLPLIPVIEAGQIEADGIIIDAKSGVSGAGRAPDEAFLFTEVSQGIYPYGIAHHRHAPEIEQGLSDAAGSKVTVTFTPHLAPMNRGLLSTIYVRLANGASVADLRRTLTARYGAEPFVRVVPEGVTTATQNVTGSNLCLIGVFADRVPGRAIVTSVIDNLVKGASGQAVQNFNLVSGLAETTGLAQDPLFP